MKSKSNSNGKAAVPLLDLVGQHRGLHKDIQSRWGRLFQSGEFVLGSEVLEFENRAARYLGIKHAIGCASGTDALRLALRALGIGAGDEVITTAFSFFATAGAILQEGVTPVFVDIAEDTYNIDPFAISSKITSRTKAILPVHLYGCPADMQAIGQIARRHGLRVIEDAAQAMGASIGRRKAGTFGDIGCFSFYPTKNLGALGDGGLVCTADDTLAQKLRSLRVHGSQKKYVHEEIGINSRLDSLQAAVLNSKFGRLNRWNARRQSIARMYNKAWKGLPLRLPVSPDGYSHVYHLYVIACAQRVALAAYLKKQGVEAAVYYPVALPLQPCLAHLGHKSGDFPRAEKASREVLAVPEFPEMTEAQVRKVIATVQDFFDEEFKS